MDIDPINPRKALNKAFLKVTPRKDKLESQIDQLVYELYGLTEEEIRILEESVK